MIITTDEVRKIAAASRIEVYEHELEELKDHLQAVITYAERIAQVVTDAHPYHRARVNVFRDDQAVRKPVEPLLEQAPVIEEGYFVVPRILE